MNPDSNSKRPTGEKIEQQITVGGRARVGRIIQIGRIDVNPAKWQDAIWDFASKHHGFVSAALALEVALWGLYHQFRNLYLIPLWYWSLGAVLLLAAVWSWYSWRWLNRIKRTLVLALVLTLSLGGVIGWQAWQIAFPTRFAPETFSIALAEFGEGPDFEDTTAAKEISEQVYEHLCTTLGKELGTETVEAPCETAASGSAPKPVELRTIGIVPDSRTAKAQGERLGADVVIWGQLLTSGNRGVTIHFQIKETLETAVHPNSPTVLPITATSTDITINEIDLKTDPVKVKDVIALNSIAISAFTFGLKAYLDGDLPAAVAQIKQAEQAIENSQKDHILQVPPKGLAVLYFYLGRANNNMGRLGEGQTWLTQAEVSNPEEPAVPLALALGYGSLGQDQKKEEGSNQALNLVNSWLKIYPNDKAALYDRGIIYSIQKQPDYALLDYDAAIEQDPNFYIAYISFAQAASEMGRLAEAEEMLKTAIRLAPEVGTSAPWLHLNLALVYQKGTQPDAAKAEYLRAIQLAPKVDWMYYYYAQFLVNQKDPDGALLAYQRLAEVTWNKAWGYSLLADLQRRQGLLKEAIINFQRAIREEPDNLALHASLAATYAQLGASLKQQGLLSEALANFQQAVHETPEDGLLHTYLAETYFALGDVDSALREFEQGIVLAKDVYYVYESYAGVLFELHKFDLAAQNYEKSLRLRPIDEVALLNLGQTYEALSQNEKAKAIYFRILKLADNFTNEAIDTAIKRLHALGVEDPSKEVRP